MNITIIVDVVDFADGKSVNKNRKTNISQAFKLKGLLFPPFFPTSLLPSCLFVSHKSTCCLLTFHEKNAECFRNKVL